jgi:hypothetical protein
VARYSIKKIDRKIDKNAFNIHILPPAIRIITLREILTHIRHFEKVFIMKRLLIILIITFSFQSWTKADDIRDFEIEEMSVGDSLLDYYSKEQVKKFLLVEYPSSTTFIGWETDDSIAFKEYSTMTFHVKSNDNTLEIFSMKGMLDYQNRIKDCMSKKKEIVNQIKDNINYLDFYTYEGNFGKKFGKSIAYISDFDLPGGGSIRIWCSTWDKDHKESKHWIDTLNVSAGSKPFFDFLNNEAYK